MLTIIVLQLALSVNETPPCKSTTLYKPFPIGIRADPASTVPAKEQAKVGSERSREFIHLLFIFNSVHEIAALSIFWLIFFWRSKEK